jgi:hypothetical protein
LSEQAHGIRYQGIGILIALPGSNEGGLLAINDQMPEISSNPITH